MTIFSSAMRDRSSQPQLIEPPGEHTEAQLDPESQPQRVPASITTDLRQSKGKFNLNTDSTSMSRGQIAAKRPVRKTNSRSFLSGISRALVSSRGCCLPLGRPKTETKTTGKKDHLGESIDDGFRRFEETGQQVLLPGIPDDITLDLVTPKLPWRTFYVLSAVSRSWKQAIRSREGYAARVRSQATETLVVINPVFRQFSNVEIRTIGVYSMRDNSFHLLPPLPNRPMGIPRRSQCISLDGKIYVMGGERDDDDDGVASGGGKDDHNESVARDDMYVMDLAGQRGWKKCSSMRHARTFFGLGAIGGKICVFGGTNSCMAQSPVYESEVYDPESDSWDPIKCTIPLRSCQKVIAIGEEVFLYGGIYSDGYIDDSDGRLCHSLKIAHFLEVYHPKKDEYRRVEPSDVNLKSFREVMFVAQGQLHSMTKTSVDVYHMDRNAWIRKPRHAFESCHGIKPVAEYTVSVDNELVTTCFRGCEQSHLLCSVGFGGQAENIVWHKAKSPFEFGHAPTIHPIRL